METFLNYFFSGDEKLIVITILSFIFAYIFFSRKKDVGGIKYRIKIAALAGVLISVIVISLITVTTTFFYKQLPEPVLVYNDGVVGVFQQRFVEKDKIKIGEIIPYGEKKLFFYIKSNNFTHSIALVYGGDVVSMIRAMRYFGNESFAEKDIISGIKEYLFGWKVLFHQMADEDIFQFQEFLEDYFEDTGIRVISVEKEIEPHSL